jgi:HSP20 family protein
MQIVKYNPFRELRKMERDLDNMWGNALGMLRAGGEGATMDLYEEDGKLIAEVSLPNYNKDEITVSTDRGMLEVSAEHKEEKESKDKRHYYVQESSSQYYRRVKLPEGTKIDDVDASFKDGVLRVAMPIEAPRQTKTIDIK